MKRVRVGRWSGQLLTTRPAAQFAPSIRHQSSVSSPDIIFEDGTVATSSSTSETELGPAADPVALPSPPPERALHSAKLAALHARLSLSEKIPLQTLARTLVDSSADESLLFNNVNLSFLGMTVINYHITEWLMVRYPRLPMDILYAALKAYAGPQALYQVARGWGVESAAAPGEEVDPGLLQFSLDRDRMLVKKWGYVRPEAKMADKYKWRRGLSSRVVLDDDFGQRLNPEELAEPAPEEDDGQQRPLSLGDPAEKAQMAFDAHASFVRAVVGAIYTHCGREAVKSFVRAHVLSRQLDLSGLFQFKAPTRELVRLCAREEFEKPVARLESETGRLSRTPVFVVGIYSGRDKLGEGAAASLDAARHKAAMNALKAWYLYSPGENVRVPSDMLVEGAKPWEPVYVDIGEIV
ncbi:hypothetical protein NKR23_g8193 [Pleurostoma richardsiae]|uniref:Large ribosomal subunit protein mL44 n=1 Tax=Pleurostoma richardsiae TaxID=41990 RepID=A0AA38VLJ2_9PEZI|nr:hypothetical protein NKR23_g8193 [Pleurostoma richardsiae]